MSAPTSTRIGIHAGFWVGDWSDESARFAIESSAAIGFDLIEIPAVDRSVDLGLTKQLLSSSGLTLVVSLALTADSDINSDDAARVARGEQSLLDAVAMAAELGAEYVGGVTYSMMGKYRHRTTASARSNSLRALGHAADVAAASGITIGVEYVNRYESNLLNTAAQTVEYLNEVGRDNVIVHLDTFHANSEETSLADAVNTAGGRLGYIHASESHRGALGTGMLDWNGLFTALAEIDYRGPITFESFSRSVQPTATADDIGLWRTQWVDQVETASSALGFIRSGLEEAQKQLPASITTA